jgi:transposase
MREQLRRVGTPAPEVIGIDEVSIRKGHTYRIVVSDLLRRRPIRVIQRRAYGLRDEEYLRLKVLTCILPEI